MEIKDDEIEFITCSDCGLEVESWVDLNEWGSCHDCVAEYITCTKCGCDCYPENITDIGICYECTII